MTVLLEYLTQPCIQKPAFGMIQCIYSWKIIPLSGHNIVLKHKWLDGETKIWSYCSHASRFSLKRVRKKFHAAWFDGRKAQIHMTLALCIK